MKFGTTMTEEEKAAVNEMEAKESRLQDSEAKKLSTYWTKRWAKAADFQESYLEARLDVDESEQFNIEPSEHGGIIDRVYTIAKERLQKHYDKFTRDVLTNSIFGSAAQLTKDGHTLIGHTTYTAGEVKTSLLSAAAKEYTGYFKFITKLFLEAPTTPAAKQLQDILAKYRTWCIKHKYIKDPVLINGSTEDFLAAVFYQYVGNAFEPVNVVKSKLDGDLLLLGVANVTPPHDDTVVCSITFQYESHKLMGKRLPKGKRLAPPQRKNIYDHIMFWLCSTVSQDVFSELVYSTNAELRTLDKEIAKLIEELNNPYNTANKSAAPAPVTANNAPAVTHQTLPAKANFTHLANNLPRATDRYTREANLFEYRHNGHRWKDGTLQQFFLPGRPNEAINISNAKKNAARMLSAEYRQLAKNYPTKTEFYLTPGEVFRLIYGKKTRSPELLDKLGVMLFELSRVHALISVSQTAKKKGGKGNQDLDDFVEESRTVGARAYLPITVFRDKISGTFQGINIMGVSASYYLAECIGQVQENFLAETRTEKQANDLRMNTINCIQDYVNEAIHDYMKMDEPGYNRIFVYENAYRFIYDFGDGTGKAGLSDGEKQTARKLIRERFKEIMEAGIEYHRKVKNGLRYFTVAVQLDEHGNVKEYKKGKALQIKIVEKPLKAVAAK
jgi:hypothetical protein